MFGRDKSKGKKLASGWGDPAEEPVIRIRIMDDELRSIAGGIAAPYEDPDSEATSEPARDAEEPPRGKPD